ncbi:MinD/ParA family ATP-binding protein [Halomarina oriensis]|uniref:P-loop NTPase n=1 Tax=Halomarina oriensis TaxID=671145 RepID=A0A6B0GMD7_9EURY|nr:P-loop NTPase [Halomarina oriensis]MWG33903.1 P-loop NTPase [Halomarina oriensis]
MLAVTGGKGGVGKTTTTLGLARALGRRGESVVVVDADRDLPNLARMADVPTDRTTDPSPHRPTGVPDPVVPSVRILTAPRERAATRRLLRTLDGRPGRVLVDCPAGAGRDAVTPLALAARSVVVSTPAPADVRDAAKSVAMARTLDAPPVASTLTGRDDSVTALERVLPTPCIAVPRAETPLETASVTERYRELSECATLRNG